MPKSKIKEWNKIFRYVVVQNEHENTKYCVLNDIYHKHHRYRYLELEDCRNFRHKDVRLFPIVGKTRALISEEILSGVDISDKYMFAKIIGDVLLIEYKNF